MPPSSSVRPRCTPSFAVSVSRMPLRDRTEQADFFLPLSLLGKRRPAQRDLCTITRILRDEISLLLPYSAPCIHPFPHHRFALFFTPYSVTLPSTTLPTYRPAERNCITFCPFLASCAHRDSVSGFCSSPRKACPSNSKSTSRSRFRGVSRTANFLPSSSTSAAPSTSASRQTFTIAASSVMAASQAVSSQRQLPAPIFQPSTPPIPTCLLFPSS